jgi:hypothetical protein
MKKEIDEVICIRSDYFGLFTVGEKYKCENNIPIKEGHVSSYTWDNHVRNININLAKFKK